MASKHIATFIVAGSFFVAQAPFMLLGFVGAMIYGGIHAGISIAHDLLYKFEEWVNR